MQKGVVKFFNNTKGFGFIAPEDGSKDVFVHISSLQRCGIETLNEDDNVEFTVEEYKGRMGVGEIKIAQFTNLISIFLCLKKWSYN